MKKITLLSLMLVTFIIANAQLFEIAGVKVGYLYVGPKLGGNVSTITGDAGAGVDKKMNGGYQFGAVSKLGITKKLAIQPELVLSSRGRKGTSSFGTTTADYKYFGLPVVAKYAFASIMGIDVYGSGGIYTDYMTGGEYTTEWVDAGFPDENYSITDYSFYNRVDFGFNFGVGATIPLKNKDVLSVDFRYAQGVVNVSSAAGSTSNKNTSFQLSAFYLIDITKWVNFRGSDKKENDAYEEKSAPAGGSKVDQ